MARKKITKQLLAKFRGVMPAIVSPHDGKDRFDPETFARHADFLYGKGVHGLYVCGATGEGYYMRLEERRRAVEVAVERSRGKGVVIAHVGSFSTRDAVELAAHAGKCGADAVASIPPLWKSQAELVRYYREIARASRLPMFVYHVPVLTNRATTAEELVELLSIEGAVGLKFTDWNLYLMRRVLHAKPEAIIFNGYDEFVYPGLLFGAQGCIGTWYNVFPHAFVNIFEAVETGDHARAWKWQDRLHRLFTFGWKYGFGGTLEILLERIGIVKHAFRHPYQPFDTKTARVVKSGLKPVLAELEKND